jgi:hypothetical protein
MYDVLYMDRSSHCKVVATGLGRGSAAEVARAEAQRRRASRMFLAGSAFIPRTNAVLVIRSGP